MVHYPGAEQLTGTLTVAELLAHSAIERIQVLAGGGAPHPDTRLNTQNHVRPEWRDGMIAMPAAGGGLIPFEVPNPTPCCADHA